MLIFVETSSDNLISIDVNPAETVKEVKAKIQDKIGIAPQRLIFSETYLDDARRLFEYNIPEYSKIYSFSKKLSSLHYSRSALLDHDYCKFESQEQATSDPRSTLPALVLRNVIELEPRNLSTLSDSFSSAPDTTTDDSLFTSESDYSDLEPKPKCSCRKRRRSEEEEYPERKSAKTLDVIPVLDWSKIILPQSAESSNILVKETEVLHETIADSDETVTQIVVPKAIPVFDWSEIILPQSAESSNILVKQTEDLHEIIEDSDVTVAQIVVPTAESRKQKRSKKPGLERKQAHEIKTTVFLKKNLPLLQLPNFLYLIDMDLRKNPVKKNPAESVLPEYPGSLGLLLNRKLPTVNSFSTFTTLGLVTVTLHLLEDNIYLTEEQMNIAENLHKFIVGNVMKDSSKFEYKPDLSSMSFYVIPILHSSIDWLYFEKYSLYGECNKAQLLPISVYRIECLLLAEELRQKIKYQGFKNTSEEKHPWPLLDLCGSDKVQRQLHNLSEVPRLPCEDIITSGNDIHSFCREVDSEVNPGPDPGMILQALTLHNAKDVINNERLEVIGDAFLEFAIVLKLCLQMQKSEVYQLHEKKINIVKNLNLYELAEAKELPGLLIGSPFVEAAWTPPCYTPASHRVFKKKLCDKCIADTVQALIGTFLLASGQRGALIYMDWIGLDPLPVKEGNQATVQDFKKWPKYPRDLLIDCKTPTEDLAVIQKNYKYDFHKLCSLGNVIIEYLVTRVIFEDQRELNPSEITNIRAEITSKRMITMLALKQGFHENFQDAKLRKQIDILKKSSFFEVFKLNGYVSPTTEHPDVEEDVYRTLSDVFRAAMAIIFVESDNSIDAVWKSYEPMIKPALAYFLNHSPLNVVEKLQQLLKKDNPFSYFYNEAGVWHATVLLPNGIVIEKCARVKRVAKINAAIKAIQELKKIKR